MTALTADAALAREAEDNSTTDVDAVALTPVINEIAIDGEGFLVLNNRRFRLRDIDRVELKRIGRKEVSKEFAEVVVATVDHVAETIFGNSRIRPKSVGFIARGSETEKLLRSKGKSSGFLILDF